MTCQANRGLIEASGITRGKFSMFTSYGLRNSRTSPSNEFSASEWLLSNIGSLVFGGKPAELLNVNYSVVDFSHSDLRRALGEVTASLSLSSVELHETECSQKILLYSVDALHSHLSEEVLSLLTEKFVERRREASLEQIFQGLSQNWQQSGYIPHEIGFFLGYPLEDVFGYIANEGRSAHANCGWQVYGCVFAARRLSNAFLTGRSKMLALLEEESAGRALLERVKYNSYWLSSQDRTCPASPF